METISIRPATPADAPCIARGIIMAVGEEIALSLAGSPERRPLIDRLFTELALMDDSQYSYLNSHMAVAADGTVAGIVVAYDGALLHELRRAFTAKAAEVLGLDIDPDKMHDETSPDEVYLDSLAVFPEFRGRGIARRLIACAADKAGTIGKPLGLLCEPENRPAAALYTSLGFTNRGQRPFAGVMMNHMQL